MPAWVYIYIYICIWICIYIYIYMYLDLYLYMCVVVHMHMCIFIISYFHLLTILCLCMCLWMCVCMMYVDSAVAGHLPAPVDAAGRRGLRSALRAGPARHRHLPPGGDPRRAGLQRVRAVSGPTRCLCERTLRLDIAEHGSIPTELPHDHFHTKCIFAAGVIQMFWEVFRFSSVRLYEYYQGQSSVVCEAVPGFCDGNS